MRLENKATLITGGASGFGAAFARRFAREVAAVGFLAGDEASFLTGVNLLVDGGWTAG